MCRSKCFVMRKGQRRELKVPVSSAPVVAKIAGRQGQTTRRTVHFAFVVDFFRDPRTRRVLRLGSIFECPQAESIALPNIVVGSALTTASAVLHGGWPSCFRRTRPLTFSSVARQNLKLNSALSDKWTSRGAICALFASYECRTPFHKNRNELGQPEGYAVSRRSRNTRDVLDHQLVQIMVHPHPGSLRNLGSCLAAVHKTASNPFKEELGAA